MEKTAKEDYKKRQLLELLSIFFLTLLSLFSAKVAAVFPETLLNCSVAAVVSCPVEVSLVCFDRIVVLVFQLHHPPLPPIFASRITANIVFLVKKSKWGIFWIRKGKMIVYIYILKK